MKRLKAPTPTTPFARERHLAWHRSHLPEMLAPSGTYFFVLVPVDTSGELAQSEMEYVTDTGRPAGKLYANPLQLISPRDPELTAGGPAPLHCPREMALIQRLCERATAAAHILPPIVSTGAAPPWSRGTISDKVRRTLWRAGGA